MASTTSLPAVLSPTLTDREAIADALYRFANALDTDDGPLFDSAFVEDASFTVNGRTTQGLKAIHSDIFDMIAKRDTTHFVTNIRINIDGKRAKLTASTLAQHYRGETGLKPDQTSLMTGVLYWVDLVKVGSLWKMDTMQVKPTWTEGDWNVMEGLPGPMETGPSRSANEPES